jgi:hypothetical protein
MFVYFYLLIFTQKATTKTMQSKTKHTKNNAKTNKTK